MLRIALPVSCLVLCLAACSTPGPRDTFAATAKLVRSQSATPFTWRLTAADDAAMRARVQPLLERGLTAEDAVAVAYLASPDLQLALERLEVSRASLVAATRIPNPVAVVGVREPGGALAAFYPTQNVTVGVLQNVLALLNQPARRRIAQEDLVRARLEAADRIVGIAAEVNQAWLELAAAERIAVLRVQAVEAARAAVDRVVIAAANGKDYGVADVANERGALFGLEAQVLRARLDIETARARLAKLMGVAGAQALRTTTGGLPPLPATDPDPAALEHDAPRQRLDLRAARSAILARLNLLRLQRRFRWLGSLELGVFRESAAGGMSFTGPNAVVELPVFDQRQAQLLEADAEYRSARRTLEQLTQLAYADLRTHAAEIAATRALIGTYRDSVLANQQQLAAQLGSGTVPAAVEGLRLRQAMLATEEQLLGLQRDYWRARGAQARAAGDWAGLALPVRAPSSP